MMGKYPVTTVVFACAMVTTIGGYVTDSPGITAVGMLLLIALLGMVAILSVFGSR
jgi:hypothetical protein